MEFETYLSIVSLALGVGGFIAALWPPPPFKSQSRRRGIILLTCLVAFILIQIIAWSRNTAHLKHQHDIEERIIAVLKTEAIAQTVDQLRDSFSREDPAVLDAAISALAFSGRLQSRPLSVTDAAGLSYKISVYYTP